MGDAVAARDRGGDGGHGPAERRRGVPEVARVAADVAEDVRDADLHVHRGRSPLRAAGGRFGVHEDERVGPGAERGERGGDGRGRRQREHPGPADAEVGDDVGQEGRRHARARAARWNWIGERTEEGATDRGARRRK